MFWGSKNGSIWLLKENASVNPFCLQCILRCSLSLHVICQLSNLEIGRHHQSDQITRTSIILICFLILVYEEEKMDLPQPPTNHYLSKVFSSLELTRAAIWRKTLCNVGAMIRVFICNCRLFPIFINQSLHLWCCRVSKLICWVHQAAEVAVRW